MSVPKVCLMDAVWDCENIHAATTSNQQSTIYNQTIFTGASSLPSRVVCAVSGVNNNLQTAAIHISISLHSCCCLAMPQHQIVMDQFLKS